MSNLTKKIKLHYKLPVTFNDFTPIPPEKIAEVKNFLLINMED